jgi:hypothetical protein
LVLFLDTPEAKADPSALALEKDEYFLDKVRSLDETSTWTVGICNGVG